MIKTLLFVFACTMVQVAASCTSKSDHHTGQNKIEDPIFEERKESTKPDYQIAKELKNELLNNGIDTILYYKRTCIDCCDFYNLFWIEDGQPYLHKLYYSFEDNMTHSVRVKLNSQGVFEELNTNYSVLKRTSIKDNMHEMGDGTSTIIMSSHYCYSAINIYTSNDSIISGRMKDMDFNKSSGVEDENGKQLPNDNYLSNINSKWHNLLSKIENEIASSSKTSKREKEIMRELK